MLTIDPVGSRKDLLTFARLPRQLYRDLPGFVPPLDFERLELLDPKRTPFFGHGEACYWIARQQGQPVGRISAQVDHLSDTTGSADARIGLFGCLDAVDDHTVVQALVDRAETWLAERGIDRMRGPFVLSINGESGLQVEGQEHGAMVLMPWHPSYLAEHVTRCGLTPAKDLLAYTFALEHFNSDVATRLRSRVNAHQITVRGLDLKNLDREAAIVCELFNNAWSRNWGFTPLTLGELKAMTKGMRPFLYPESAVFVEVKGEPVAFALLLPNLYEIVGDLGGRLLPLNWLRLAWRTWRRPFRSCRMLLLGVHDRIRQSVLGAVVPQLLIAELVERGRRYQMTSLEASWILEDNMNVRSLIEANGAICTKRYRVYEKHVQA
jgi:hypothetical protein